MRSGALSDVSMALPRAKAAADGDSHRRKERAARRDDRAEVGARRLERDARRARAEVEVGRGSHAGRDAVSAGDGAAERRAGSGIACGGSLSSARTGVPSIGRPAGRAPGGSGGFCCGGGGFCGGGFCCGAAFGAGGGGENVITAADFENWMYAGGPALASPSLRARPVRAARSRAWDSDSRSAATKQAVPATPGCCAFAS